LIGDDVPVLFVMGHPFMATQFNRQEQKRHTTRKFKAPIHMALKMRPTGLGPGVYKENVDYGVFCGE
jgi:hypothetical protein